MRWILVFLLCLPILVNADGIISGESYKKFKESIETVKKEKVMYDPNLALKLDLSITILNENASISLTQEEVAEIFFAEKEKKEEFLFKKYPKKLLGVYYQDFIKGVRVFGKKEFLPSFKKKLSVILDNYKSNITKKIHFSGGEVIKHEGENYVNINIKNNSKLSIYEIIFDLSLKGNDELISIRNNKFSSKEKLKPNKETSILVKLPEDNYSNTFNEAISLDDKIKVTFTSGIDMSDWDSAEWLIYDIREEISAYLITRIIANDSYFENIEKAVSALDSLGRKRGNAKH